MPINSHFEEKMSHMTAEQMRRQNVSTYFIRVSQKKTTQKQHEEQVF